MEYGILFQIFKIRPMKKLIEKKNTVNGQIICKLFGVKFHKEIH